MKNFLFYIAIACILGSCNNSNNTEEGFEKSIPPSDLHLKKLVATVIVPEQDQFDKIVIDATGNATLWVVDSTGKIRTSPAQKCMDLLILLDGTGEGPGLHFNLEE